MNDYETIAAEIGKVKSGVCGISLDGLDEGTREIVDKLLVEAATRLNSAQGYLEWVADNTVRFIDGYCGIMAKEVAK